MPNAHYFTDHARWLEYYRQYRAKNREKVRLASKFSMRRIRAGLSTRSKASADYTRKPKNLEPKIKRTKQEKEFYQIYGKWPIAVEMAQYLAYLPYKHWASKEESKEKPQE